MPRKTISHIDNGGGGVGGGDDARSTAGEQKFNTDLEKILNSRVQSLYTVSSKTSNFLFFE